MHDAENPRGETFESIRREFEQLKVEDRALFLLEATVSTVAQGIDQLGKFVTGELERVFRPQGGGAAPTPEQPHTPTPNMADEDPTHIPDA